MEQHIETLLRGGQFRKLLSQGLKQLKNKYKLNKSELQILYYLNHCGEKNTSKDVSTSLEMNKGQVSRSMDSLCSKGHVRAEKDTKDFRVVHYSLNESADQMTEEIDATIDIYYRKLFEGLSDEDLDTMNRVSSVICGNITRILDEIN